MVAALRHFLKLFDRQVKQRGHLVDECAGSARAGAIHADIGRDPWLEEDHFCIFPADIDQGVDIRMAPDHLSRGDHFLQEG